MDPITLGLILAGAGAAATAGGTYLNNRAHSEADRRQSEIINAQRAAYADQRAAIETRQSLLSEQLAQDAAMREEQRALLNETQSDFTPDELQKDVAEETARLQQVLAPPSTSGDINQSAADVSQSTGTNLSGKVFEADQAAKGDAAAEQALQQIGALAALTAYDTSADSQATQLGLAEAMQGMYGRARAGSQRNYDQRMNVLKSGEQALGAGAEALGNQIVPLDTSRGDMLNSLGQIGLTAGAGMLGGGFFGAGGLGNAAATAGGTGTTMANTLSGVAYGTSPLSQQSRMLAGQQAGMVPWF